MDRLRSDRMGQSHHHGGTGTLPLRQHNVVRMPEAAAAPFWNSVGDSSSGAQASFIYVQHNHSANNLEVQTKLEIFKIQNPLKVIFHTFAKCGIS